MIFLTVGTLFPFDRLVRAIDSVVNEGLIGDEIFAQIGYSTFKPKNMKYTEVLNKNIFDEKVNRATCLISHAGIGSIIVAMNHNKPLLVMPRMKYFKEHVNDHQVAIARKFEELGHILVAYEAKELPKKIKQLRTFVPYKRDAQRQVVTERITRFLKELRMIKEQGTI